MRIGWRGLEGRDVMAARAKGNVKLDVGSVVRWGYLGRSRRGGKGVENCVRGVRCKK